MPSQAQQTLAALRTYHTLTMRFATFAGSKFKAFEQFVRLELTKRELEAGADCRGKSRG